MNTAKIIVGVIHILLSITMIALILLQTGKRAGMAGVLGGSSDTFYGKNKTRTMDAILGRFTKICAIGFLVTSLFLAYGDTMVTTPEATTQDTQTPITAPADINGSQVPVTEAPAANVTETAPDATIAP